MTVIKEGRLLDESFSPITPNNPLSVNSVVLPSSGVKTDIGFDAWGREKSITDFSVFHGLFTYDIPASKRLTFENGVEVFPSTRIVSDKGGASIKSGVTTGNSSFLRSKRHPRYQPNRGHLFSTAGFLPVPTGDGIRQIGLKNTIAGVYFELNNGVLYAVILNASSEKVKEIIDLSIIGLTISDLQYGHLYDVQFQRRGVGDYFFYIDQKLVYKTDFLGKNIELTIFNPAISVGFYCENTNNNEVEIRLGCVDVTTEGGGREGTEYSSVANASTKVVNTANYPVLITKIKDVFNGLPNTRDVLALRVTGSSDQRAYMKAYITRDPTAITGATFNDAGVGSCIEYDVLSTAIDIAKCKLLRNKRIEIDSSGSVNLPSNLVDFFLTGGDYLIITFERESPTQIANVIATLEMGEEV